MSKFSRMPRIELRGKAPALAALGTLAGVLVGIAACFPEAEDPEEPIVIERDGITFEEDGTAIAGRVSGREGWVDVSCIYQDLEFRVVQEQDWKPVKSGRLEGHRVCDDGIVTPDDNFGVEDIPEALQG